MRLWKLLWVALVRLGIAGLIVAFIAGIVAAAYFASVFPDWTGFGPPLLDAQGHELPHAKTLWDWLGLLLIPLVLAVGGYFLTRSENRYALQLQERREAEARKIEMERAQDAALQAYLDQMTQLLLHEKLRTSQPDDEVRSVARARTLTVLRMLDGERAATVLQFLYGARLIGGYKQENGVSGTVDAIVSLSGAYLQGAYLQGAHLQGAHLQGVYLQMAHLQGAYLDGAYLDEAYLDGAYLNRANLDGAHLEDAHLGRAHLDRAHLIGAYLERAVLSGASLTEANLNGALLYGANLDWANLTDCKVTREQLAQAVSLEGAKLPFDMTPSPAPE